MRNQFISSLVDQAKADENIFLLVGDLGYGVVEPFVDLFPERFINLGVAEQNMLSVAAGIASEGARVFVYSIANFPTFRAAEQIRNDVDYHNLPVTIVTVGGGLSYGNLGYSHHAIQDYGLMRLFPNMEILAPGCPQEVKSCMNYIQTSSSPSYLRLAKAGEPVICDESNLAGGQIYLQNDLGESCARLLLTTGNNIRLVLDAVREGGLLNQWNIATLPVWGMKYKDFLRQHLAHYQTIVTVEDHIADGGFGSYVREASDFNQQIDTIHLNSESVGAVGNESYLRELGGVNSQSIIDKLLRHQKSK